MKFKCQKYQFKIAYYNSKKDPNERIERILS